MSGLILVKSGAPKPSVPTLLIDLREKINTLEQQIVLLCPNRAEREEESRGKSVSIEELHDKIDTLWSTVYKSTNFMSYSPAIIPKGSKELDMQKRASEIFSEGIFAKLDFGDLVSTSRVSKAWCAGSREAFFLALKKAARNFIKEASLEELIKNKKQEQRELLGSLHASIEPRIGKMQIDCLPGKQQREALYILGQNLVQSFLMRGTERKAILEKMHEFLLAYMAQDNITMNACLKFFGEDKKLTELKAFCEKFYNPSFLQEQPLELQVLIFSYLSLKDLGVIARLNSVFKEIGENALIWQLIRMKARLPEIENGVDASENKTEKQRVEEGLFTRRERVRKCDWGKELSIYPGEGLAERVYMDVIKDTFKDKDIRRVSIKRASMTGELAIVQDMLSLLSVDLLDVANKEYVMIILNSVESEGYIELLSLFSDHKKATEGMKLLEAFASGGFSLQLKSLFENLCKSNMVIPFSVWEGNMLKFIELPNRHIEPRLCDAAAAIMGERLAIKAIENGHLDILKWIIDEEKLIEGPSETIQRLFKSAATFGHLPILKWFIDEKQWVDCASLYTILEIVAQKGYLDILKWVSDDKGMIDFDSKNELISSLIRKASARGHVKILNWLAEEKKVSIEFLIKIIAAWPSEDKLEEMIKKEDLKRWDSSALKEVIFKLSELDQYELLESLGRRGFFDGLSPQAIEEVFKRFTKTTFIGLNNVNTAWVAKSEGFLFKLKVPLCNYLKGPNYIPEIIGFFYVCANVQQLKRKGFLLSDAQKKEIVQHHLLGINPTLAMSRLAGQFPNYFTLPISMGNYFHPVQGFSASPPNYSSASPMVSPLALPPPPLGMQYLPGSAPYPGYYPMPLPYQPVPPPYNYLSPSSYGYYPPPQ